MLTLSQCGTQFYFAMSAKNSRQTLILFDTSGQPRVKTSVVFEIPLISKGLGWYFDKIFIMCPKTQHLELQLITLKNYETFFGGFAKGQ